MVIREAEFAYKTTGVIPRRKQAERASMQCTRPLQLPNVPMPVPCGKCRACRISRSREWATRIQQEASYYENNIFVTLTYSDENLPKDKAVYKKEVQLFIKRLRKELGDQKIKYFACGEYGEETKRAHYHLLILNMPFNGKKNTYFIEKAWTKGRIDIGTVTYNSARYVADYIQKDDRSEMYDGRTPPFSLKSQGLGKQYAIDNKDQIIDNLGSTVNGIPVGLPKIYMKWLEIDNQLLIDKARVRSNESEEILYKRAIKNGTNTKYEREASQKQKDKNIKARISLKTKGRL